MKGLGSLFQCSAQVVIAWLRLSSEVDTPRRRGLSVSSLDQRSIRFSHELEVGVKCRCQRHTDPCVSATYPPGGVLWADRWSKITCTDNPPSTVASICWKKANTSEPG